jgi:hypothetical protein
MRNVEVRETGKLRAKLKNPTCNCTQNSPLWGANSRWPGQEMPRLLCDLKFLYGVQNGSQPNFIQPDLAYSSQSISVSRFNIITLRDKNKQLYSAQPKDE